MIALCFLVYSQIDNEDLWRQWLNLPYASNFRIFVHSKHAFSSNLSNVTILPTVPTEYAGIGLINATIQLYRYAIQDTSITKFVLVSQSCIPVKTPQHVYQSLTKNDKSIISLCPSNQVFPRYKDVLRYLPSMVIIKHHQWISLNRRHAQLCIDRLGDMQQWYRNVYCPDESAIGTCILVYDGSNNVTFLSSQTPLDQLTFTNWSDNEWPEKWKIGYGLKNYSTIDMEELERIYSRQEYPLFARKFLPECKVKRGIRSLSLIEAYRIMGLL